MKKMRINPAFAVITIMLLGSFALFTACPNEPPPTTGDDANVISVKITLDGDEVTADISANKGATLAFGVNVEVENNASQEVTWSISGNKESTTLSDDGTLEIGLDEEDDAELLITATSVAASSKSDTVKVIVLSADAPAVTSVTISAAGDADSVAKGATLQFTAVVAVENGAADTVTWAITSTGHAAGTSIDADGLLTVDADETEDSITVTATPTQAGFASKAESITVTVAIPIVNSVTISAAGDADSVPKGLTLKFTAVVDVENGAATTVIWEITSTGHAAGTGIDEDGLLTVDAAETKDSITVKATPTQAGFEDKAETITVDIVTPTVNSVTISTEGDADLVELGDTLQFTAVVDAENGAATTVTWEITSTGHAAGTSISASGLLTVDAAETEPSITVKAIPTQAGFDDKADEVTVTVSAPLDRTNYALGKGAGAVASRVSQYNTTALAENAFDGIRWQGSQVDHWQGQGDGTTTRKQWIGVDLGSVMDIGYVIVVGHEGTAPNYDVFTAGVVQVEATEGTRPTTFVAGNYTDTGWKKVGKFSNPDKNSGISPVTYGLKNVIKLDAGTRGRYIRVKMQDPETDADLLDANVLTWWPRVSSFEVYLNLPKDETVDP